MSSSFSHWQWLERDGEAENMGVCTKKQEGTTAVVGIPTTTVLMATSSRGQTSDDERRWVLLKIPRCDIDGVGEGK